VLHSHVTGLIPAARGSGLGRAIKLHQRAWAVANEVPHIVWTFDPLVRRNAWFNIAVLGAEVTEYLPSFYGSMTDAINAGDDSDRLLVTWNVTRPVPDRPRDGHEMAGSQLVAVPDDVVALRRTDPLAVAVWRARTRSALTTALAEGRPIVGFTRAGHYVIGSVP
jgi:predicted GNAT superfamily acetyltransferase